MKHLTGLLAAGAAVAVFAADSSAQTETFTSAPVSSQLTDWTASLVFPEFNPALGILDSVTLDLSSSMSTVLTVVNNSASSIKGSSETEVAISVLDPDHYISGDIPQLDYKSAQFSFMPPHNGTAISANSSRTSGTLTGSSDYTSEAYTGAGMLGEFTGNGNISLAASTFTMTDLSYSGANADAMQDTTANLTGSIVYDYTPRPRVAPDGVSTFGLLALSSGALPLLRRLRK